MTFDAEMEIAAIQERLKALDFYISDVEATLQRRIAACEQLIDKLTATVLKDRAYYTRVIKSQQSDIDELQCAVRKLEGKK